MKHFYESNYEGLTDKQLVEMVLAAPGKGEPIVYLLYELHWGSLLALYYAMNPQTDCFDDCLSDLYVHLQGTNLDWSPLASFEWRSGLGSWLTKIASHEFPKTIQQMMKTVKHSFTSESIDADKPNTAAFQIADTSWVDADRHLQRVLLLEEVGRLKDDDRRFVIQKWLKGYRSREIAEMLRQKWDEQGIIKYNNKGKRVVPNEGYVNVCRQRAKEDLREILKEGCYRNR